MGIKQAGSLTDGSSFKLHNRKWLGHTVSKIKQGFFFFFLEGNRASPIPIPHFTKLLTSPHTETNQTNLKRYNLEEKLNVSLHEKRKD